MGEYISILKAKIVYTLTMHSKKNIKTIKLNKGDSLKKEFINYEEMAKYAVDWTLFCSYQLKPKFPKGIYKILQLPSMQIVYTDMAGGIMFNYVTPEECITLSVMKNISQKACIDQMKLETDMVVVTDDTKVYNLICSDHVEFFDISLNRNADPELRKKLSKVVDRYFIDHDQKIITLIQGLIDTWAQNSPLDLGTSIEIEKQITQAIIELLKEQTAQIPYFTKSEKIALKIKQKLFKHMDGKMRINNLAQEYRISTKSLQNAFQSLFALTPNKFMRLLKLNLVHQDLAYTNASETTVQAIAQKWGFGHMGRFSKYYTELFGQYPSSTLKMDGPKMNAMQAHCVERQEEML